VQLFRSALPDVWIVQPTILRDRRGQFAELFNARTFAAQGIKVAFVQDNLSVSTEPGVVRGLHFQVPPAAQAKLVRVARGAALDVSLDIRRGSPTYGMHVAIELSAENGRQVFIPAGFAHGFATLEANTEVIYKVSDFYSPAHEFGLLWNDPDLGIAWPLRRAEAVLSERDERLPRLRDWESPFRYEG